MPGTSRSKGSQISDSINSSIALFTAHEQVLLGRPKVNAETHSKPPPRCLFASIIYASLDLFIQIVSLNAPSPRTGAVQGDGTFRLQASLG